MTELRRLIDLIENAGRPPAEAVARDVRAFLEQHWTAWHEQKRAERATWSDQPYPHTMPSSSMCRFTCVFLASVLQEETGERWKIVGGEPHPPLIPVGGMRDNQGEWHGHYWLRLGQTILDITADQFGYDPVIVATAPDQRYLENYSKTEMRQYIRDAQITPAKWLAAYASHRERIQAAPPS